MNVEELVFGSDASLASSQPVKRLIANGSNFDLSVSLETLPEGVFVVGETSLDLEDWFTNEATALPQGFLIPGGDDQRFLRLRYSVLESAP